ncbi:unnamed protein product [Ilex paraguariensis]|uniref:Uncharacterized protein n=1 Tax=Ilex paraguariensis TaxID=185542 RepID=A0ABC8QNF3_9AQUA
MMGFRMSWFFVTIILSFTFTDLSEARHEKKLPSAVVVGTVYCDTCFQEDFSKSSHFISGASVAVECGDTSSRPSFRKEVKTNEHGEFKVHLPFSVSKHVQKIEGCSVKLISTNQPYCAVASTATSSSLHLKSKKPGTHIFSAGFFTFKPLKQPDLCYQKPSVLNSKKFSSVNQIFSPPTLNPSIPILPPLPQLPPLPPLPQLPPLPPLPQLPPLPPLPGLPYYPPVHSKTTSKDTSKTLGSLKDQKIAHPEFFSLLPPNPLQPPSILPPNPFQPPPSILPPNPLQPPPSIFPPIFPSPPPSIFPPIPFPPIPGITPSPPPPPPSFPFPLPPLPLPPLPFPPSPGIPPASSSSSKKTSP